MKTPVNKATVDTAKEIKFNNNHKNGNEFCFKKKNPSQWKKGIIVFCEVLVNN